MVTCVKCGQQTDETTQFCTGCGSFLEWTGHKPAVQASSSSILWVTPSAIAVEPGGEALCQIRVRNTGTVVDEFQIELAGEVIEWAAIDPPGVSLFPGKEEVGQIKLQPPRSPMVRAGQRSLTIRVRSALAERGKTTEQQCVVTVGQFTAVEATLAPTTSEAVESAVHTLMVRNEGNAQVNVQLRASNPDDQLLFEFDPTTHVIEPGGSAASRLRVSRRQGVSHPERRFPFKVYVETAGTTAVLLDGALVQQRPAMPHAWWGWRALAFGFAAFALLLIAGLALIPNRPGPLRISDVGRTNPSSPTVAPTPSQLISSPTPTPPSAPQQAQSAPQPVVVQPQWTGWTAQSGGTTNVSAAATVYNGKLYVFGIGINDHSHYVDVFDGSNWSGSLVPGGGTTQTSDATAVYNGRLYLFGIGINDHQHYMNSFDGSTWSGWGAVPGGGTTNVADAVTVFNGKLYLFGIGINDHGHYVNVFDGSNWSGWSRVPGGGTTQSSDAASVYNGKLYLFGIGINDHGQYVNSFDGSTWSGWMPVKSGRQVFQVATISYHDKLYLVALSADSSGVSEFFISVFDGTSWSDWSPVTGLATTLGGTSAVFNDKLYLFGIGSGDLRYYVNTLST